MSADPEESYADAAEFAANAARRLEASGKVRDQGRAVVWVLLAIEARLADLVATIEVRG